VHNFNYPLIVVACVLAVGFLLWFMIDPMKQLSVPDEISLAKIKTKSDVVEK